MDRLTAANVSSFAEDVLQGLSAAPKYLSSKYFYDDEGSRLFRRIMELPEYYLTRAELEIFQIRKKMIFEAMTEKVRSFDLIELGAGDGSKTAVLIDYFLRQNTEFTYVPIDISEEAIATLRERFRVEFPDLTVEARTGDYFRILEALKSESAKARILLFLGSNIGNFTLEQSIDFFRRLRKVMNENDLLLTGFDLHKDPRVILRAYDDSQGVTAAFNLNLLRRINRELDADFDLNNFSHYAIYLPTEYAARSFLISREDQTVYIKRLDRAFEFRRWEPIFVEVSQKYSLPKIEDLARESGFEVRQNFFDNREYFVDSLWQPKPL